ncbi:MAG TPA: bifunctional demethylmenaquinone methyltransferase/2-methoxy-6-polyprenyl-1,4-benzoquinol methylase, partial [Holosporales bacterium]|nr:bifunctional demethylmenaquinone methyltransferase/2-methoxy-6-polyprenyl-1,4-benzoquinol methylase [Holosporales bacterium]
TVGNAESTPFRDESFDIVTISFGLRNCTYKEKVLSDALRVLKPSGAFYCLEFSKPTSTMLRQAYDCYSFSVIPKMGKLIAQDEASYEYLVESIRNFPDQESLKTMMKNAGFNDISHENLTGGIVAIHKGIKQ